MPTCGFLAKKEGVWCDLSKKGANLWIFSEKGNCVAQPPQREKTSKKLH